MSEANKLPLNLNLGAEEFIPGWLKKPVAPSQEPVSRHKSSRPFTNSSAAPFVPTAHSMMSRDAAPFIPHANNTNGANIFSSTNTITNRRVGPALSTSYAGALNSRVSEGNRSAGNSPMASVTSMLGATPGRTGDSGSSVVSPLSKPYYCDPSPKTPVVAAAVIGGKTQEELRNISLRSDLKVTAASFVPSQRRMKDAAALTPMSLAPVVDDPDMLLGDTWCLYFVPSPAKNELFEPVLVFRIDSVASFWKAFNNLPPADEMPARSSMYLFRDDILPKWEDPKNSSGGLYTVSVKKSVADEVWIRTAAKTIGESWKRSFRNNVNGVVFKPRDKAMKLEVWVSKEAEGFGVDWFSSFEEVVEATGIDYCTHLEKQQLVKNAPIPKKTKHRRQ